MGFIHQYRIQTNMKLQLAVLFACFLAFGSANIQQQAQQIQQQAQEKINASIAQSQQILNQNNVDFDVSNFVNQVNQKIQAEAQAQNYQKQAEAIIKNSRDSIKNALKKSQLNQNVKKNLLNLLKNVEAEAKKAINA